MGESPSAPASPSKAGTLLRARILLPVNRAPIPNGAVLIIGKNIAMVGRWRDLATQPHNKVFDLGETLLMPGLVNAHCHLDYTGMAGLLPPPRRFTDWLQSIVSVKAHWTLADYRKSWQEGAAMLLESGTTTVADVEAFPELLPEAWNLTPLRLVSFIEMIGLSGKRNPQAIVSEVEKTIARFRHARSRAALSPHAPYSTLPALLRLSAQTARKRHWLLCTHVAESVQEFEMFTQGEGEMFEWLRRSGRDMSDCGSISPVQQLNRSGFLGKNLLAIHANYLGRGDARILARQNVSVVHCPRSHAYFGHQAFPWQRLRREGVNICLGTDSLATVYKARRQTVRLSMFDEMREFASRFQSASPRTVVRMATVNGARALGWAGKVGDLRVGAFADLIALPFEGKRSGAYEAVVQFAAPIAASMIGGRWALKPSGN